MKTIYKIMITSVFLFSFGQAQACPGAQSWINNVMAMQGGMITPIQYNEFTMACARESGMHMGAYGAGGASTASGGCSGGLYSGQDVHPDRCLGGMLASEIIQGLFQ